MMVSQSLLMQRWHPTKGRVMRLQRAVDPGEVVLSERPLVCGACCGGNGRCPGCCEAACIGRARGCAWAGVACDPRLARAVALHLRMSSGAATELEVHRACFTAIVLQALADPVLQRVMMSRLHAQDAGPDADENARHTRELATQIAESSGRPLSLCFALLMRTKLNAFQAGGPLSMAVYAHLCLVEHACRPLAAVRRDSAQARELALVALQPIAADGAVSFCYLASSPWGLQEPVEERRRRLLTTKGFRCECDACRLEAGDARPAR